MKNLVAKSFCVILAMGSLMPLQSCHRIETPAQLTPSQIGFNVDIESVGAVDGRAASRAGVAVSKTAFVNGDKIGLWVVPYTVTGETVAGDIPSELRPIDNYLDNVLHTYATSAFNPSKTIFYPNTTAKVDLYAVHPYDAKMSDATDNNMADPKAFNFAVEQDQTDPSGAAVVKSDIMTAFFHGAKSGSNGTLSFRHRMSRVMVAFTVPATYKTKSVIDVQSVVLCGIQLKSLINISDTSKIPTLSTTDNPKVEIKTFQAERPNSGVIAGAYKYEAIVTPTTTINAGEVIAKVTLNVTDLGPVEFICKVVRSVMYEAKKQTNINIALADLNQITFADVTIQGWGTPIEINDAQTTKVSHMIISCVAGTDAINTSAIAVKLNIEGDTFDGVATYDSALPGYRIQYDHKLNRGGYLKGIEMTDAAGAKIFTTATLPAAGLQIKGDPTFDNYATVIGTMTFNTDGTNKTVTLD